MIESTAISRELRSALKEARFVGRGNVWRRQGADIQWVLAVDRAPRSGEVTLVIGLDLQTATPIARADDCAVVLYPEVSAALDDYLAAEGVDRWDVRQACSPRSALSLTERRSIYLRATRAIADYLDERQDLAAVRAAFRREEFSSGAVRKDARAILST